LEDTADVGASLVIALRKVVSVAHKTASLDEIPDRVGRGDRMTRRERDNLVASIDENSTDIHQEAAEASLSRSSEGRIDFAHVAGIQDDDLLPDASSRCLQVCHISERGDAGRIGEDANHASLGHESAHQFEPLRPKLYAQVCHARHIAARSVEASDE